MKICTKCKVPKDESEFDKRTDGRLVGYCSDCRKERMNEHYRNNKDYYKIKAIVSRKLAKDKYVNYKKTLFCTDCGISFKNEPYLCDFHHELEDLDKIANPSALKSSHQKFLKEVEKCTPLCANCHRRRHNKQE